MSATEASGGRTPHRGLRLVGQPGPGVPAGQPLPPLASPAPAPSPEQAGPLPGFPEWSPLPVALPLFGAVWLCFGVLAATVSVPSGSDVAGLAALVGIGAGVIALLLLTLSVVHAQVSGLPPRPAVLSTVALGGAQAVVAAFIGTGLWGVGAWVFAFVGVAVPLAWVGGQFQSGVRRHRVAQERSLVASFTDAVRRQAQETVESIHRHDVRSMLFIIEGAASVLADPNLPAEQRASFTDMLRDGAARLAEMTAARSEDIAPFAVTEVVRAVAHAERKAGRSLRTEVPADLSAVGRVGDVTAVLRTLTASLATGPAGGAGLQIRAEEAGGAAVLVIEAAGVEPLPLLSGSWEEIRASSFKISSRADEEEINLFVAARLLGEQGGDLWSTAGRARFAVRLTVLANPSSEEPH
ncbi:MAG TPA: hypothetical protein VHL53_19165 [Acidimicrobiia bacterium]|nr:hypothetical protein [Acidimicrobiia bacterium]